MGQGIVGLGGPLATLLLTTALLALATTVLVVAVVTLLPRALGRGRSRRPDVDAPEPAARRFLRLALGGLWVVDGLLQAQPLMPAGFVTNNITPHVPDEPGWLREVTAVGTRAWDRHPVVADAAAVWLEIGLGIWLIVGRRALGRAAAVAGIVVALGIWLIGEGGGGLFASGAGWLAGAPGAALVYALAAALLLLPHAWWTDGRARRTVRVTVAGWLLVAAALQAIPAEGFWTGPTLAQPFADGAAMSQPSWLAAPMRTMASLAGDRPALLNAVLIAVLVGLAGWLLLDRSARPVVAGVLFCGLTWWVGQDFGVLGGTATDPNTALPLGLLLAGALPVWQGAGRAAEAGPGRTVARRAVTVLAVVACLAVPAVLAVGVTGPPDADALAADSQGGLRTVPARALPAFALHDQTGALVRSHALRGKAVVITFLDPVCSSECPLIAAQLAEADRKLGSLAGRVEVIAIDSNPVFHRRADVAAFTQSHGLAGLANWHFLWGEPAYTQDVLAAFGMAIDVPTVGMIEHSSGVLFVSADGRQAAYLDDGAALPLTASYADVVERELRGLTQ